MDRYIPLNKKSKSERAKTDETAVNSEMNELLFCCIE